MGKAAKSKIPSGIALRVGIMIVLVALMIVHYFIKVKDVVVYEDVVSDSINNTVRFPFDYVTGIEFLNHDPYDEEYLQENSVTLDLYLLDSEDNIVWEKVYHDIEITEAFQEIETNMSPGFWVSPDEVYTVGYSSVELYYMQRASIRFLGEPKGVGGIYWGICAAIILFMLLILIISYQKRLSLQTWALILIIGLGILFNLVMPPFSVPDEQYHFAEAYHISDKILRTEAEEPGRITVSEDLNNVQYRYTKQTYYSFWSHFFEKGMRDEMTIFQEVQDVGRTGAPSYAFWPAGLGITLARLLKLNYQGLLLMGRFMNLLFAAICIYWAIRFIPIGKKSLLALSILPMNVCQIASFSYDSMNFSLISLCIALLVRLIYRNQKAGWKDIIALSVLSALALPIKAVYLPVLLLLALIPQKRFKNRKDATIKRLIVVTSSLLLFIIQRFQYILQIIGINAGAIISYAAETGDSAEQAENLAFYTFGWVLEHPLKTLGIYLKTLYDYLDEYWLTAIGWKFADVRIPYVIIVAISIVFLLVVMTELQRVKVSAIQKVVWTAVFLISSFLVVSSMFFGYTPFGYKQIEGVQGRYFLPLGMCLPFMLQSDFIKLKRNTRNLVLIGIPLLDVLVILSVFSQMMRW